MSNSSYTKQELESFEQEIEGKNMPKSKYWTTLDGYRIPINKIKDEHLKNILKHLNKRMISAKTQSLKEIHTNTYKRFEKELMRRVLKTPAGKILYGR